MTPVLIVTKNNLELNKLCIESVRKQDVAVDIHVYDNNSTDGTREWIQQQPDITDHSQGKDLGVSAAWNLLLNTVLCDWDLSVAFVVNNDVILPPWFIRELSANSMLYRCEFITGIGVDSMEAISHPAPYQPPCPHPDFSSFALSRKVWDEIGPFDESMVLYSSDQDYHLRGWMKGVPMYKSNTPFYHVNSQTLKRSDPETRAAIEAQANSDRERLFQKWGVRAGSPEYSAMFSPENFGKDK